MNELEAYMRRAVHDTHISAMLDYESDETGAPGGKKTREEWVKDWPGQVVLVTIVIVAYARVYGGGSCICSIGGGGGGVWVSSSSAIASATGVGMAGGPVGCAGAVVVIDAVG